MLWLQGRALPLEQGGSNRQFRIDYLGGKQLPHYNMAAL